MSPIASCVSTEGEDLPVDSEDSDSKPDSPCSVPSRQDGVLVLRGVFQVLKSIFTASGTPIFTQDSDLQIAGAHTIDIQTKKSQRRRFFPKWRNKPESPCPVAGMDITPEDGLEEFMEDNLVTDMHATTGPSPVLLETEHFDEDISDSTKAYVSSIRLELANVEYKNSTSETKKVTSSSLTTILAGAHPIAVQKKESQRRSFFPKWWNNKGDPVLKYQESPPLTENQTGVRSSSCHQSANYDNQALQTKSPLLKRVQRLFCSLCCSCCQIHIDE